MEKPKVTDDVLRNADLFMGVDEVVKQREKLRAKRLPLKKAGVYPPRTLVQAIKLLVPEQ